MPAGANPLRIGLAIIALGAAVRISGRERDGHCGRRPASHCHRDKKNQKILHRPQPAVPCRLCARQKRLTGIHVKPTSWRTPFKCAVIAVTQRVTDPIVPMVIGPPPNDWLINGARRVRQKQDGEIGLRTRPDLGAGLVIAAPSDAVKVNGPRWRPRGGRGCCSS
jgi:hypothetical protein